ncbi:serine protease [Luteolibacter flavescens]|uniref:Serine protease n=1 Tax=Luteolibacter flavescens TaxID=1859460 RepID=A0ABT3FUV9_9BACT|nr:serine protease [Luteolibacter flavescens]MCW1887016.1 serine protease [Luteolibacter flavescens]
MSDARDWVWYIECRPFATKNGSQDPDFAPSDSTSMGSAVAVELESIRDDGTKEVRKYLLTCGHVVRQKADAGDKDGWGMRFGEILCFPPHEGYVFTTEGGRKSGEHQKAMFADIHPSSPHGAGTVPESQRRETNDWALLEVRDGGFQDYPAVKLWSVVEPNLFMQVIGYPGGAGHLDSPAWPDHVVAPHSAESFRQTRTPNKGMLKLEGPDETRPGMSGGGVFGQVTGCLLGLHRGSRDGILVRHSISIELIRERLSQANPVRLWPWNGGGPVGGVLPPSPLPSNPCMSLSPGRGSVIPFINRTTFRGILQKISDPASEFRAVSLTGPNASGKSWSVHLVRHVAAEKGMPMALLNLSAGQTIAMACRRLARDLRLDVSGMEKLVLEDQATEETIGQKFAYWLIDATSPPAPPAIPPPRSILMVDGIHTGDGAYSVLYEQLIAPLIEELKAVSGSCGLILILAGSTFPADLPTKPFVLEEHLQPLTHEHVAEFLTDYAAGVNRSLSLQEHSMLMLMITGGATGSFNAERMAAVTQQTTLILENGVL